MIEAAGGVVWRLAATGELQVIVVHRPRYDDWSLPKGKLDPGETAEAGALREVEEETGLRCELGAELPSVEYVDRHGRPKRVRYWAMERPLDPAGTHGGHPGFEPNDEVDALRWVAIDDAAPLLTYDHDALVVDALRRIRVPPT